MTGRLENVLTMGPFAGEISGAFQDPALEAALARLPEYLAQPEYLEKPGRNRLMKVDLPLPGGTCSLAVKQFGVPGRLKSLYDRKRGTKAARSWQAAEKLHQHGVGTPQPVGYLEEWSGSQLVSSYYLSRFEPDLTDFKQELLRIFYDLPHCESLMRLLQSVAPAIKAMHDAGVMHMDLGNQNIHLRRVGESTWSDVQFLDLNRCRIHSELSLRDRARDLSRLHAPSDLLRIIYQMYFEGPIPLEFSRWEAHYRRRYLWHARTRKYRHPLRRLRQKKENQAKRRYPDYRNIWIWDDRSAQPVNVVRRKERNRLQSKRKALRVLGATIKALPLVWPQYRRYLREAYTVPVEMKNRVGVAVEPTAGGWERQRKTLQDLGPVAVLIRFYHHQGPDHWAVSAEAVRQIHEHGHEVAVALVQDRKAVLEPESWSRFVQTVMEKVHPYVKTVEVGHAINRVKWGIWSLKDYRHLMDPVAGLQKRYPEIRWTGPAGIDFEYPYVLGALQQLPAGVHLDALSHHLYVDRRGAPENDQEGFSTLEKCALARALSRASHQCDDRFIVSEVNWPLLDTGVHSPVGSPYLWPGQTVGPPSVSEEMYGYYMVRYLLVALCSGMAEQVYWWRLVARGFGLVDDTHEGEWRVRPAFKMLQAFMKQVGSGRFLEKLSMPEGVHAYLFERENQERVVVVYAETDGVTCPFSVTEIMDAYGKSLEVEEPNLTLTGAPVYVRDTSAS